MQSNSSLTAQVVQILDRLCSLPGRRELSVETRRYPRFLPADSGTGFEQKLWSFNGNEIPLSGNIAIPTDAEDVVVTWTGTIAAAEALSEINMKLSAAVSDLGFRTSWDFEVFARRRESDNPQVVVRVFRNCFAREF